MRGYRKHWSWWQQLARELWCILAGHRWVSSWRRVGEYDWHRAKRGNPYFDYVASWHGKCRRCRLRTREDVWQPLWRMVWYGLSAGVRDIGTAWGCYAPWGASTKPREGASYYRVSKKRNLFWLAIGAPVQVVKEVAVYLYDQRWMPMAVVDFWCDLEHGLMERCEANTTYYSWLPPDGKDHGLQPSDGFVEHALWMRSDLVDKDPLKRTRTYVCVVPSATLGEVGVTGTTANTAAIATWIVNPQHGM